MKDIVEQLKEAAAEAMWPAPHLADSTLYSLAAEEIERLRKELATWRAVRLQRDRDQAMGLREALIGSRTETGEPT